MGSDFYGAEGRSSGSGWEVVAEHSRGPAVSVAIHALLIVFLSGLIVRENRGEPEDIHSKVIEVDLSRSFDIPKPPPIPDDSDARNEPDFSDAPSAEAVDSMLSGDSSELFEFSDSPAISDPPPLVMSDSAKILRIGLPGAMSGRKGDNRTREGRRHAVRWTASQKALRKGLDWLASHQNEDGSWGDSAKVNFPAYTGLALLAFLGHGEDVASKRYGTTVLKALKRLLAYLGPDCDDVCGGYRHAIALYAVSEAYALSRVPMLRDAMEGGMRKLIAGQNSKGSFNYGYNNRIDPKLGGPRCDLSVAGWNYQAMKAAFTAGCAADGLEAAYDKAVDVGLLKTHFTGNGFRYGATGGATPSMTAVGTLCLQLMGRGNSKEVRAGVRYLQRPTESVFVWKGRNGGGVKPWSLYQWYYQTQVFFQAFKGKGGKWRKFDKMFTRTLLSNQKRDGRWESPGFESGYGKKSGEGALEGIDQPVYSTSLCCLMLEVYYRYLATFKVAEHRRAEADCAVDGVDLILE